MSKEDSRKVSHWLNTTSLPPMRWGPRRKRSNQRVDQARQLGRETRYAWISVKKILLPKGGEKLDQEIVKGIAESIAALDLLHPIAVRRVTEETKDGETKERIALVTGAHRLEAMKRVRKKKIPCIFVDGDEAEAQLVRLAEDLWRKTLTVLRRSEMLVEYVKLASAKMKVSGQLDQKGKPGRPPSGIALAARELTMLGPTADARRKKIERAKKIARIVPEAKKAATKARLANNQKALSKIAEAGGPTAQLKMVAELAEISKKLTAPVDRQIKKASSGANASKKTPSRSDAAPSSTADQSNKKRVTTLDEMISLWDSDRRASWAYLQLRDREKFIEILRRAKRRARPDVAEFLSDVFRGRGKVSKLSLLGIALAHGISKKLINTMLPALGYRAKRRGWGAGSEWFVWNHAPHWKGELRVITDAELGAAEDAQRNARHATDAKSGRHAGLEDYLNDIP
jgi:ParB-like chromosome segregation protein Spo0J